MTSSTDYPLALNPAYQQAMQEQRAVVLVQDHDEIDWPVVVYYFANDEEAQISHIEALDKNYGDLRYDVIEEIKRITGLRNVTIE